MNRILLLEDDESLIDGLKYTLEKNGFSLDTARTTAQARALLEADAPYGLLLLDVTLPDGSGFDLCTWVRARDRQIPIIFLTASDEELNIIRGLDSGGDDYITKPFKLAVLMSRINALLRRSRNFRQVPGKLCSNGIILRLLEGRAYKNNVPIELTAGEYRLLRLFMENPNAILSAEQILGKLWDCDGNFVDGNTLAVYIRRLRAKIEDDPAAPTRIVTVRRMGYKWNAGGGQE